MRSTIAHQAESESLLMQCTLHCSSLNLFLDSLIEITESSAEICIDHVTSKNRRLWISWKIPQDVQRKLPIEPHGV